jgi:hypothetical protein
MTKITGFGSFTEKPGSTDTDPYQNVMDPQHCVKLCPSQAMIAPIPFRMVDGQNFLKSVFRSSHNPPLSRQRD